MISTRRALIFFLGLNLIIATVAVLLGVVRSGNGNPSRYFGEGRWTLVVSCLQLLAVAVFAFRVFSARRATLHRGADRRDPWLWFLIGIGFVFLAADDALQIHERVDSLLHRTFKLDKNGFTDRIDDAIVGVYAVIGLSVLGKFRRELLQFRSMLKALGVGCAFAFACIACDALSNRPDIFTWLTGNAAFAQKLEGWFAVGDGTFQLLAQGSFVAAFYLAWRQTASAAPTRFAAVPAIVTEVAPG